MNFKEINVESWPRAQMYAYFSQMAPTGYSLTAKLDVTKTVILAKEKGVKFFPIYLWLVTKNLIQYQEFTCAVKDGRLGYYDTLTPLYASWHENTKTFSLMWTEYEKVFSQFYEKYLENQAQFGRNQGLICQPVPPPENAYTVSEIPWISFEHFAVHSYDNKPYYFPSVEAGKYKEIGDSLIMPISITCHHATTDGYHVSMFLKDLQEDFAHPENWFKLY